MMRQVFFGSFSAVAPYRMYILSHTNKTLVARNAHVVSQRDLTSCNSLFFLIATDDRMCRMAHHHQNNQLPCTRCDNDAALADRRSAHNALERQRREHLNTKFQELAHALPSLQNIRRPSKTMIVSKSLDFGKMSMPLYWLSVT